MRKQQGSMKMKKKMAKMAETALQAEFARMAGEAGQITLQQLFALAEVQGMKLEITFLPRDQNKEEV